MLKKLVKVASIAACLSVLSLMALPTLVSFGTVNQFALSCLNKTIPGKVYAHEVQIGWLNGVHVQGLEIKDPQGRSVAHIPNITYEKSLLSLLYRPTNIGKLSVENPKLQLIDDTGNGNYSLEEVFSTEKTSSKPKKKSAHTKKEKEQAVVEPLFATVEINDANITFVNKGQSQVQLKELNLSLDIQDGNVATLSLNSKVAAKDVPGSLQITAKAKELADLKGAYLQALQTFLTGEVRDPSTSEVELQGEIVNFPLQIIHPLASHAIGPSVSSKFSHSLKNGQIAFTADVKSQFLNGTISSQKSGSLLWQMQPSMWSAFSLPASTEAAQFKLTLDPQAAQTVAGSIVAQVGKNEAKASFQTSYAKAPALDIAIMASGEWPSLASRFVQAAISPVELIGKELQLETQLKIADFFEPTKSVMGSLVLQSDLLSHKGNFSITDNILTMTPATTTAQIQPVVMKKFLPDETTISGFQLSNSIQSLEMPLDFSLFEKLASFDIATGVLPLTVNQLQLQELNIALHKEKAVPLTVRSRSKASLELLPLKWQKLLGSNITFEFQTEVPIDENKITIQNLSSQIVSDTIKAKIPKFTAILQAGALSYESIEPIEAQFRLQKEAFSQFVSQGPSLQQEALFSFEVAPFKSKERSIKALAKVNPIQLGTSSLAISLPLHIDTKNNKVDGKLQLTSLTDTMNLQGSFSYDLASSIVDTQGTFQDLSTPLIDNNFLPKLVGDKLSGDWNAGFDKSLVNAKPLTLHLQGKELSLGVDLRVGQELTSGSKKPLELVWKISPERFQALLQLIHPDEKQQKLSLLTPIDLTFICKELSAPFASFMKDETPTLPELLDLLRCDFRLSLTKLECKELLQNKTVLLPPIEGSALLQGPKRTLAFKLESQKLANASYISLLGEAKNLWNEKELQPSKASVKLDATLKEFPLDLLQVESLVAVAGPKINAELNAQVDELHVGKVKGTVNTPILHTSLDLLIQDNTLFLNEPLVARYELTAHAGDVLLKGVNPLLASGAKSNSPITLLIDKKDFRIPLSPFSLKDIVINSIKIDPGVLTVKNGGLLGMLISLLKMEAKSQDQVNMWFTPIYIEMKDGIVNCKRADALVADTFPIATWGTIDLAKDTIHMTLGLSGETLRRAFKLVTVSDDYFLQIPIRGTMQSPKIDTALATTKIAALRLRETPSPTTAILGGLLEVATAAVDREPAPPPATTYPFPWKKQK